MKISYLAYIPWPLVSDALLIGWMMAADLSPTHGEYSALMRWPCGCEPVKPKESRS